MKTISLRNVFLCMLIFSNTIPVQAGFRSALVSIVTAPYNWWFTSPHGGGAGVVDITLEPEPVKGSAESPDNAKGYDVNDIPFSKGNGGADGDDCSSASKNEVPVQPEQESSGWFSFTWLRNWWSPEPRMQEVVEPENLLHNGGLHDVQDIDAAPNADQPNQKCFIKQAFLYRLENGTQWDFNSARNAANDLSSEEISDQELLDAIAKRDGIHKSNKSEPSNNSESDTSDDDEEQNDEQYDSNSDDQLYDDITFVDAPVANISNSCSDISTQNSIEYAKPVELPEKEEQEIEKLKKRIQILEENLKTHGEKFIDECRRFEWNPNDSELNNLRKKRAYVAAEGNKAQDSDLDVHTHQNFYVHLIKNRDADTEQDRHNAWVQALDFICKNCCGWKEIETALNKEEAELTIESRAVKNILFEGDGQLTHKGALIKAFADDFQAVLAARSDLRAKSKPFDAASCLSLNRVARIDEEKKHYQNIGIIRPDSEEDFSDSLSSNLPAYSAISEGALDTDAPKGNNLVSPQATTPPEFFDRCNGGISFAQSNVSVQPINFNMRIEDSSQKNEIVSVQQSIPALSGVVDESGQPLEKVEKKNLFLSNNRRSIILDSCLSGKVPMPTFSANDTQQAVIVSRPMKSRPDTPVPVLRVASLKDKSQEAQAEATSSEIIHDAVGASLTNVPNADQKEEQSDSVLNDQQKGQEDPEQISTVRIKRQLSLLNRGFAAHDKDVAAENNKQSQWKNEQLEWLKSIDVTTQKTTTVLQAKKLEEGANNLEHRSPAALQRTIDRAYHHIHGLVERIQHNVAEQREFVQYRAQLAGVRKYVQRLTHVTQIKSMDSASMAKVRALTQLVDVANNYLDWEQTDYQAKILEQKKYFTINRKRVELGTETVAYAGGGNHTVSYEMEAWCHEQSFKDYPDSDGFIILDGNHGTRSNASQFGGKADKDAADNDAKYNTHMLDQYASELALLYKMPVLVVSGNWQKNNYSGPLDPTVRQQAGQIKASMMRQRFNISNGTSRIIKNAPAGLERLNGKRVNLHKCLSHSHGAGEVAAMVLALAQQADAEGSTPPIIDEKEENIGVVTGLDDTRKPFNTELVLIAPPVGIDTCDFANQGFPGADKVTIIVSIGDMTQALGTLLDQFQRDWSVSLGRKLGGIQYDNVRCITIAHDGCAPNHKNIKYTTLAISELEKQAFSYHCHHDLQADISRTTGKVLGFSIRHYREDDHNELLLNEKIRSREAEDNYLAEYNQPLRDLGKGWFRYVTVPIKELAWDKDCYDARVSAKKHWEKYAASQKALRSLPPRKKKQDQVSKTMLLFDHDAIDNEDKANPGMASCIHFANTPSSRDDQNSPVRKAMLMVETPISDNPDLVALGSTVVDVNMSFHGQQASSKKELTFSESR